MAELKAGEDWAFFEVWQDNANKVIWYKRISDPNTVRIAGHSTTYIDANKLEAAADADPTKVVRSAIPGDWALAKAGVTGLVHKHDYMVPFI